MQLIIATEKIEFKKCYGTQKKKHVRMVNKMIKCELKKANSNKIKKMIFLYFNLQVLWTNSVTSIRRNFYEKCWNYFISNGIIKYVVWSMKLLNHYFFIIKTVLAYVGHGLG